MTTYGKGCKLRSADHKRAGFAPMHTHEAKAAGPPDHDPSSDLMPHCPYRLNQGRSSACGGHAPSVWLVIAASIAGISLGFSGPPSPRYIYGGARAIENPGTAPLEDSGVEPADPILAVQRFGVVAMPLNPDGTIAKTPDGRVSDVTTADDLIGVPGAPEPNVGARPTAVEIALGSKECVLGAWAIEPTEPYFLETLAAALSGPKPKPIASCIWADTPFYAWGDGSPPATKGVLGGVANFGDGDGGGHYVTIVGHRTEADGTLSFLILNSWSEDWGCQPPSGGPAGLIWVGGAWLRSSYSEGYAIDIQIKAAA